MGFGRAWYPAQHDGPWYNQKTVVLVEVIFASRGSAPDSQNDEETVMVANTDDFLQTSK